MMLSYFLDVNPQLQKSLYLIETKGKKVKSTAKWEELGNYYKKVFYKPDLDTLRIVLSAVCGHYLLNEPPVWLFVIGPSSAGKTSQIIDPLKSLKLVNQLDVINDKTFVNGYEEKFPIVNKKGGGVIAPQEGGLLFRLKGEMPVRNGIITFSDWSMFTSLKDEVRRGLQSQFRGIYDGSLSHAVGNNRTIKWDGKVTMIIAGTKEVEEEMGNMSGLGDRFMKVRMRFVKSIEDRVKMFNKAAENMGKKGGIKEELERLVFELIHGDDFVKASKEIVNESVSFPYLLEIASLLRRTVTRERRWNKIVAIGETENNTRIGSGAIQIARGSAMLLRQNKISQTDLRLAMRTIIDNIPWDRWTIIRDLACTAEGRATSIGFEVKYHGYFAHAGLQMTLEELEALNVIHLEDRRTTAGHKYKKIIFEKRLLHLMRKAFKTQNLRNYHLKEKYGLGINITKYPMYWSQKSRGNGG